MSSTVSYNEQAKVTARNSVIIRAIATLTSERNTATLCRRSYVREVREHLISRENIYDVNEAQKLKYKTIDRWEAFYDSITQSRNPENLKVAYLCGPNPENDLRIFCKYGILPENIWAFESESSIYDSAVNSALASEFPFIKIINGGIDTFLQSSPIRFDIIYLDFCGPIPNRDKKQKTLLAISRILACHSLNSPGVLITNASLPTESGDAKGREFLAKLVACYLYPKEFIESDDKDSNYKEGAITYGYEFDEWLKIVTDDLDNYYGQFITRLIMDHSSFISPYGRFLKQSPIYGKFFKKLSDTDSKKLVSQAFHFDKNEESGNVIVDSGLHPILWTFAALDRKTNANDANYPQIINTDPDFNCFAENFLYQLHHELQKDNLIKNITELTFSMQEASNHNKLLTDKMARIINNHSFCDYYQFCDLVLSQQTLELLFRQVSVPYHVNVEKTQRWRYKAKSTQMYMDMTVLDECRYLYDWMPTSDMILSGFSNKERQLAYRFALDGVSKHRRWYNQEYFFGTAVVDQYTTGFKAKVLKPREQII